MSIFEKEKSKPKIYIIGAGFNGQAIARELKEKNILGEVVAFLDDDPEKHREQVGAIPVLGPIKDVIRVLQPNQLDEAFIAMPEAPSDLIGDIYFLLKKAGFVKIRIVPSVAQIIGNAHLVQTREIDPQDFLGRTPVTINLKGILSYLRGKRVLITGAGGSIGSELARQLLSAGVERIYLFGHGENSIYQIDRELRFLQEGGVGEKTAIVPIIGDIKDETYLEHLMPRLKADTIFHTAAYKHVPLMEENPVAVIENNVFGTKHLVDAALHAGVKRFVLISTDKAVDPICTYGVSKFLAERIVLEANEGAAENQEFMVVRFGNVIGSRGSIIPLFQKQIEQGGPVTITHPEMTRFFMTIPEACSLVLQTGGVGLGGELYVLDMGEPVRIKDIADKLIRFYGYEPEKDIQIKYIGLRVGEKIEERLYASTEKLAPTDSVRVNKVVASEKNYDLSNLFLQLKPVFIFEHTQANCYHNKKKLRSILRSFVPTLMELDGEKEW